MEKEGLSPEQLSNLINKKSGVMGVSEVSSDMREIDAAIKEGNEQAKLALDMYHYRIAKYIGAYTAALNGVDIIVFTGGVGENQIATRKNICERLSYLGIKVDDDKNNSRGEEVVISSDNSAVKVVVIPTDEELMIAKDTEEIVSSL